MVGEEAMMQERKGERGDRGRGVKLGVTHPGAGGKGVARRGRRQLRGEIGIVKRIGRGRRKGRRGLLIRERRGILCGIRLGELSSSTCR